MINKELFNELSGVSRNTKLDVPTPHLIRKPAADTCYVLERGFIYEVYFIEGAKIVSWFWGDGDVVIPTSPYSSLITGEKAKTATMTYGHLFRTLREFEDFRKMYRGLRDRHNQAVAERINDLRKLTPLENYIKLLEQKPWVFQRAKEELIASYLRISVNELRKFKNIKA